MKMKLTSLDGKDFWTVDAKRKIEQEWESIMKIIASDNLYIDDLPRNIVDRVFRDLSALNPEYVSRKRLGKWLGGVEQVLYLVQHHDDGYTLPRGYLDTLLHLARTNGITYEIDDRRVMRPKIDVQFRGTLRDYQQRAFEQMIKYSNGVLHAPCGSGKTALGLAIIAHWRQPALILVHSKDLMSQTIAAVRQWLGVEPGVIGGGQKTDIRPVTVATVQTLDRRLELVEELAGQFGLVLLDESHHAAASTFMGLLQRFPANFRYGLTATPNRADGLGSFMTSVIGPIRHEIKQDELKAVNVLVVPRVEFIKTGFYYDYDSEDNNDYTRMITALVRDGDRNELIYSVIRQLLDDGRRVIALSQRVEHCESFYRIFQKAKPGIAALAVGTMKKKERAESIQHITNGDARVLFATSLADEGLDVPCLDALVLMSPSRSERKTIQQAGRIMRSIDGKRQPVICDLVDVRMPVLRSQAHSRFFDVYRYLSPGTCLPVWLAYQKRAA
jgi:superfamily II DNA or RNA helicase